MSLQMRQWIWAHRVPFFTCVFLVGLTIGYAVGPYLW